jgi:hypothetical protein
VLSPSETKLDKVVPLGKGQPSFLCTFQNMDIPTDLKYITPYVQRGQELVARDPIVSYYGECLVSASFSYIHLTIRDSYKLNTMLPSWLLQEGLELKKQTNTCLICLTRWNK